MKPKILLILVLLIGAIAFRYFFSFFSQKKMKTSPAPFVVVETTKEDDVFQCFEAPGRVDAVYRVGVLARISGYLLKSYFSEGDYVKKGDILFLIEPTEYENASNVAKANIEKLQSQLEYANKQLKRAEELVKQDYIAVSKYDEILSSRESLVAQLAAAKSSYSDSTRNLGYTKIKAPVDGRIGLIDVSVGNYVTPSTGALTTIFSINPIYVVFPIPSETYASIVQIDKGEDRHNHKVELYFQNGARYEYVGVQNFLDNKVDDLTGTVTMRATFENKDERLLHGEFVNVRLCTNNPIKAPVVPVTAVQQNQEGKYVYKLDDKKLPQLTYIKTSAQNGNNLVIQSGLNVGDAIITDGLLKVIPGAPVKVISKEEMERLNKQSEGIVKE